MAYFFYVITFLCTMYYVLRSKSLLKLAKKKEEGKVRPMHNMYICTYTVVVQL